jgi:SAM-dependent methyltransferase
MKPRILLARIIIKTAEIISSISSLIESISNFIKSYAIMVMRPDDLVEFSRQTYAKTKSIRDWANKNIIEAGLSGQEMEILRRIPLKNGELLLLGLGTGREAIPLGKYGFSITGVDYLKEMTEIAEDETSKKGVDIKTIIQEVSTIDLPYKNHFDIIWLSNGIYSCIPTRKRRVEALKKISSLLKPDGYLACQFMWLGRIKLYPWPVEMLRRTLSLVTLGNLSYESGDVLWKNVEFTHLFTSEQELKNEFLEVGLIIKYFNTNDNTHRGEILLHKKL